jgi:hypothetical protein
MESRNCYSPETQLTGAMPDRTLCHARCDLGDDAPWRMVDYKCVCETGEYHKYFAAERNKGIKPKILN